MDPQHREAFFSTTKSEGHLHTYVNRLIFFWDLSYYSRGSVPSFTRGLSPVNLWTEPVYQLFIKVCFKECHPKNFSTRVVMDKLSNFFGLRLCGVVTHYDIDIHYSKKCAWSAPEIREVVTFNWWYCLLPYIHPLFNIRVTASFSTLILDQIRSRGCIDFNKIHHTISWSLHEKWNGESRYTSPLT